MSTHFLWLALISGYIVAVVVGLYALLIALKMYTGDIKIQKLICEKSGDASLSRFQFLIFTFVISMNLMLLVLSNLSCNIVKFPDIPGGILALLGISGGSYVVSKGIQKKAEGDEKKAGSGSPNWPAG